MKTWQIWMWSGIGVLLLVAGTFWYVRVPAAGSAAQAEHARTVQDEGNQPLPKGRPFTRQQTNDFLDAAQRAETIADPLQRCLAYPDPPGSHWDHATVVALCKYRNQPTITFAQVQQLVQDGRTAELDRMFADALKSQRTDPDALGRLDRIFVQAFGKASFDIRSTLDAWKRQSPHSAFALAASGYEYKEMAFDARGGNYISKTPDGALASMDRLAQLADDDLQRAIKLNPKITPAYAAMISLGGMTLGDHYALDAARRGFAQDPGNLGIYDELMWLEQPNWYGSLAAMDAVERDAKEHADRNPLLHLLTSSRDLYRIEKCKCADDVALSAYEAIYEQLAGVGGLEDAGYAAKDVGDAPAMTIFLSEALRFNPTRHGARLDRTYDLVDFDRIPWAIAEANAMLAQSPDDEFAIKARGWAYMAQGDWPHAEQDFKFATELDPTDMWALSRLGTVYLAHGQQWDKAWAVADRLIEKDPQHADGWVLRAQIQEQQPRPGLKQTADYLAAHFGKDLQFNVYIAHLKTVAAQRAHPGAGNAKAPAAAPHG